MCEGSPQVENGGKDPVGVAELEAGAGAQGAEALGSTSPAALLLALGVLERASSRARSASSWREMPVSSGSASRPRWSGPHAGAGWGCARVVARVVPLPGCRV